jgi:hypothetical protein
VHHSPRCAPISFVVTHASSRSRSPPSSVSHCTLLFCVPLALSRVQSLMPVSSMCASLLVSRYCCKHRSSHHALSHSRPPPLCTHHSTLMLCTPRAQPLTPASSVHASPCPSAHTGLLCACLVVCCCCEPASSMPTAHLIPCLSPLPPPQEC